MKNKNLQLICLFLLLLQLTGLAGMIRYSHKTWLHHLLYLNLRAMMFVWFGGLMVFTLLIASRARKQIGTKDISAVIILALLSFFSLLVYGGFLFFG